MKAYSALGRFRLGEPLRPWLLAIVANEARNRRRSAGRRAALVLRAAGEGRPSRRGGPLSGGGAPRGRAPRDAAGRRSSGCASGTAS